MKGWQYQNYREELFMKKIVTPFVSAILTLAFAITSFANVDTTAKGILTTENLNATTQNKLSGESTVDSYAQCGVPMMKENITLYGDEAFKQEILNGSSSIITENALYVAPSGSDTNTGSIDAPFKTVQKALDTVKAGQTIYLRTGTYTGLNIFKSSGTQGNYITLRNYPGEKPYLTMTAGTDGAILQLEGNDYIKIEGLEIGGFSSAIAQGILLNGNENHVIIRNNDIHNLLTTKPGENESGEANAILCYGEGKTEEDSINNICIENNSVHNNTTGWCESVSVTGNVKYINIINNTVYENTNIGIDFYGNAGYCSVKELDQPRYCVAAGNVVYKSVCSYAECAGLYVDGARDIVLENNIIHDSMYGIEIGSEEGHRTTYDVKNIVARNNLVYNNSAGGIRVGGYEKKNTGYVKDTKIYNNTIVNNGEGEGGWNGELCFVKCDGIDVRNNIVYKDNSEYPMIGGDLPAEYVLNVSFNNNVFYNPLGEEAIYFEFASSSTEGMVEFNTKVGGSNTFGKPTFNSNYSLATGSYGIDIGGSEVINYMGTYTDLGNNSRFIGNIDVGAFEYQDGSAPTVSTTTTEATTETTTAYVSTLGDVYIDGSIDAKDCAAILKLITGIANESTLLDINAVDFNKDGSKNILDAIDVLNYKATAKIWNYTTGENTDNFFNVSAKQNNKATAITYNGLSLTKAIKMESSTNITFDAPKAGKLTLVKNGSGSKIKINGTSYNIPNGEFVVDVPAGTVTIKKDSTNVDIYYMKFE